MRADKTKMFSVALATLNPESPIPFPIFLYLLRNDRMVPMRLTGDSIGREKYEELLRDHYDELWVPKSHEKEFSAYLEYLEKTGNFPGGIQDLSTPVGAHKNENAATVVNQDAAKTAQQVKTLLAAGDSGAEALSALAQELLKELNNIELAGTAARAGSAAKCRAFADEFLKVAAPEESLFDGVLAFRSIQEPTEHSISVGSTAAVIAAATGKVDPIWISNLLAASTFHDVGLTHVRSDILRKSPSAWSPKERLEYESHVTKGVILLTDSEDPFPKDVIRMVQEHHEKPDGSGFPNKLKEQEIFEGSRFLIFANHLDRLCQGNEADKERSPHAAMLLMEKELPAGKKIAEQLGQALSTN